MRIRLTDRAHKTNGLMPGQGFFNLCGVDVMSTPYDHIFSAARDPKISIFIHTAQVASAQIGIKVVEVFVLGGLCIGVTRKYSRVFHTDFTNFIGRTFLWSFRSTEQNFHIGMRQRQAHRTHFLETLIRVARNQAGHFC